MGGINWGGGGGGGDGDMASSSSWSHRWSHCRHHHLMVVVAQPRARHHWLTVAAARPGACRHCHCGSHYVAAQAPCHCHCCHHWATMVVSSGSMARGMLSSCCRVVDRGGPSGAAVVCWCGRLIEATKNEKCDTSVWESCDHTRNSC